MMTRLASGAAAVAVVVGLFAAPAAAAAVDPADVEVALTGTTIAADADGKVATITITNNGPGPIEGLELVFVSTDLDQDKVTFQIAFCGPGGPVLGEDICPLDGDDVPPPGGHRTLDVNLVREAGATGDAGSLTVRVNTASPDPDEDNNESTAPVTINSLGADLRVLAPDVYAVDSHGNPTRDPIPAGGSSVLIVDIFNQGDADGSGLSIDVHLPDHVTGESVGNECTPSQPAQDLQCAFETVLVSTCTEHPDSCGFRFHLPVTVAADAPGPVALTGGNVAAFTAALVPQPDLRDSGHLPPGLTRITAASPDDVDGTDSSAEFSVFVAGHLPVTGVRIGQFVALGAALVVFGALLVLLARRRRRTASIG